MFRFSSALAVTCLLGQAFAVSSQVDLGYSQYSGVEYRNGISSWLGMRFAAPPLGQLRFALPQDPPRTTEVQEAKKAQRVCIGQNTKDLDKSAEDCLFINVWAPTGASTSSKMPVFLFIHGGGFADNSNANNNATGLIKAAEQKAVVVDFNYRVGAYGFLASKEIATNETAETNIGLHDQRKAMQWVQRHISQFGGDPEHVLLGGASAGASSVVLHLTSYGGHNDNLFHAAAAESQALPALSTVEESQAAYDALVSATNCKDASSTLQCLRDVPVDEYQTAAQSVPSAAPGTDRKPVYFWGPTIDGDMIREHTFKNIVAGRFIKVPAIFGSTTNEGNIFTPKNDDLSDQAKADGFIHAQWPLLSPENFTALHSVFEYSEGNGHQYASGMYGRLRYICAGLILGREYSKADADRTWLYRWNVDKADHVAELGQIFGTDSSKMSEAGRFVQGYWASMIRAHDPTMHRARDAPKWEPYGRQRDGNFGHRLQFASETGKTGMESVFEETKKQCELAWELAPGIAQ